MRAIERPTRSSPINGSSLASAMKHCMVLLLGLLILFSANTASAATIAVNDTGDGTTGCTLRKALENANNGNQTNTACASGTPGGGDTISLPAGAITLTGGTLFILANNLTIQGAGAGSTFVSGDNAQRIFDTIDAGTISITFTGLSIQEGFSAVGNPDGTNNAAALFIDKNVSATVSACVFHSNVADGSGGAIENWGSLTVTGSSFNNNIATNGSGGAIYSTGVLVITNSTFSGNTANNGFGSAIYTGGTYTVTNSTINGTVYNAGQPLVSGITPAAGPAGSSTAVTIVGTGFDGAQSVKFGSMAAASFTVSDNEHITATAPAQSTGVVHVTVTTAAGTSATSSSDQFAYLPAPSVSGVTPNMGPTAGGTSVIVTGTDFSNVTSVTVGGSTASYTVNSATQISITTPAHASGAVDIRVTTAGGTSSVVAADQFSYIAPPSVSSVSPASGPLAGGGTVTITGSNFSGATTVSFGNTAASSFTVSSATQITAPAPARQAGTVDVTVTTVGGTSATSAADQYTYVEAPTVTGVAPASGPATGGSSVVISGTDLSGATAVMFGNVAAASYTVNSASQITATAPAGSGIVDITVTTAGGTSTLGAADKFTYVPAPIVTSISPSSGPTSGSTTVTITGSNFSGATSVRFGNTAATSFTVNSTGQISATSPAAAEGSVDITVITAGGTSAVSAGDQFTFVAAPAVTAISPSAGPLAGGTSVTITGTGFTGASAVKFGAMNAASFTVNSGTQITANSPAAGSVSTVGITVTTVGGTSATGASDQFSYVAEPTITGVSPNAGPLGGGSTVVITGTGFNGSTAVTFGVTPATGFTVNSPNQITATAPAGAAGTVDIRINAAGGTSATATADQFSYLDAPTVTGVTPNTGPATGGTSVVITGTHLANASAVKFGNNTATSFTVNSPTQITATAPAGTAGAADITVTTPGGTSPTSALDQFNYVPTPTISGISPNSGPTVGGTVVTIAGTNFTDVSAVKFGTLTAASYSVVSSTQVTATSPAGATGIVDITITTPGGTSAVNPNDQFNYAGIPAVSGISPVAGPVVGGTTVIITGAGFTNASAVKFGGAAAASYVVNSATQITASSPAGAAGAVDVSVTTPGGTSIATQADKFSYIAQPSVSGLSPALGSTLGGRSVVITGSSLSAASAVKFGGVNAISFTVNSDASITAIAPPGAPGSVDVTVTTAGGTSNINPGDQFTYDAKTFTGNLPGGGTATASFTGGGASCSFASAQFVSAASVATPPAGVNFNLGLFDFQLTGCTNSSTITMSIKYTGTPGPIYWKYGPTAADHSNHWYQLTGATVTGNTVSFSITDGGLGDDDLSPNGSIVDAGGPASPAALAPVPTLGEWASGLLIALMMMLGFNTLRRNQHAG